MLASHEKGIWSNLRNIWMSQIALLIAAEAGTRRWWTSAEYEGETWNSSWYNATTLMKAAFYGHARTVDCWCRTRGRFRMEGLNSPQACCRL